MKKTVFIIISIFLLCSCVANNEQNVWRFFQQEKSYFSFMDVNYSYSPLLREFCVLSGSFKGMKIKRTDSGYCAQLNDFTLETESTAFPHLNSFEELWRAYSNTETNMSVSDSGAFVLIVDSSRFLVYYNEDNGYVSKIVAETEYGVFEYILAETEEES